MQHVANVRALTTAATRFGITLPAPVGPMVDASRSLSGVTTNTVQDESARVLAALSGNPAQLAKIVSAASGRLATARARTELLAVVDRQVHTTLWRAAHQHRDAVAEAFAPAVAGPIAVLNEHAGNLPAALAETEAQALDPVSFASYRACVGALAALHTIWLGIGPLYTNPERESFSPSSFELLAFVDPGSPDYDAAIRLRRAIEGRALTGPQVAVLSTAVFAPSALAAAGAKFSFANPSEAGQRASRFVASLTPPMVDAGPARVGAS